VAEVTGDELKRLNALVDHLGYDLDPSILIGGWATQLRVGGEVSRDIDLIINSQELRSTLRDVLTDYSENTHHSGGKKVRGEVNGIHVDAYIPHESILGEKLRLDVAVLTKYTDTDIIKGWLLLTLDAHLATKLAALLDRPDTEKGAKDAREVEALLRQPVTAATTVAILLEASKLPPEEVIGHVAQAFDLIPDRVRANKELRRKLATQKREWVDEAERQVRRLS